MFNKRFGQVNPHPSPSSQCLFLFDNIKREIMFLSQIIQNVKKFQGFKIILLKNYKIQLPVLLFLVALHQLLHQHVSFFQKILDLYSNFLHSSFLIQNFSLLTESLKSSHVKCQNLGKGTHHFWTYN